MGSQNLQIAARCFADTARVALSSGGVVVTRNRKDSEKVPGLQIEDCAAIKGEDHLPKCSRL
jgi:hypothetical protein